MVPITRRASSVLECCVAMYFLSARTHAHWRKLTYDDWTLLIPATSVVQARKSSVS